MSRRAGADSSATPARNTRARSRSQTPLPGLATKQSHAYGAQGKTSLHTQVRGDGGNFAEEFTAVTATASPAKRGGLRQRGGRPARPDPILEDGDEDEEIEPATVDEPTDPERVQTALGHGLGYAADSAAGEGAGNVRAVREPSPWRMLWSIVLRVWFFCCLGILVYAWLPLPEGGKSFRFQQIWALGMFGGLPGFAEPPGQAQALWYRARHDIMMAEMLPDHNMPEIQWAVNLNVLERLKKEELGQEAINTTLGLHGETLQYLKRILPVTVVLQDEGEQRYHVPQEFFEALSQRIAQGGDEVSPLWESFISSNEREIEEVSLRAATRIVGEAAENKQLVSRKEFAQELEKQNLELAERYTGDYRRMWEQNFQTVRDVAREETTAVMREFTTSQMVRNQLMVLKNAVDLQNSYQALRTYNWFTFGEGAIIDPHLTSPTAEPAAIGWLSKLWGTKGPLSYTQNSPSTVLEPWTEVTDCWCAAPATDGSAQISMYMTEPMYPKSLVIEHIPAGGTRRIANAPRTIEVWADAGSPSEAQRLIHVMAEEVPYKHRQDDCTKPPSDSHVCLARGEYNIHHHNHVQQISMMPDTLRGGFAVNSFTVRIVNNWGGQRTCLYRLRMIGVEVRDEDDMTVDTETGILHRPGEYA